MSRAQEDVEHYELLPAEPDPGGHHDGHTQLHLLLHLHEGQVQPQLHLLLHLHEGQVQPQLHLLLHLHEGQVQP